MATKRRRAALRKAKHRPPRSGAPTRAPTPDLPHDTPVETPAVVPQSPRALIEPAELLPTASASMVLASGPETIEAAFDAWDELRAEATRCRVVFEAERRRLEEQGALLLGAMQSVEPNAAAPGLVKASELTRLADEAARGLQTARAALERRAQETEVALEAAIASVVAELRRRISRQATLSKPLIELMIRVMPGDRRIIQARRPSPDGAVLLLYATSGRIPTHYGALFDDSTDDALLPPATLYPEEGIPTEALRPTPGRLRALLEPREERWPVKAMLPLLLPTRTWRWLERGAVMEAELGDGDGWRNLLTREEAEALMGALLAFKLEGRLELELVRG